MQCFYCINAQGDKLVVITGHLPNKYFILSVPVGLFRETKE
jgi:hypothetical protein